MYTSSHIYINSHIHSHAQTHIYICIHIIRCSSNSMSSYIYIYTAQILDVEHDEPHIDAGKRLNRLLKQLPPPPFPLPF